MDRIDKFYTDDEYSQFADNPTILGFDPWIWASEPPEEYATEKSNASYQSQHGCLLQRMVQQRKAELMEALFPLRTSHHLQCLSWLELEYSYGLYLKEIIDRVGYASCDNMSGYVDSDITLMILEIGRFFTEIDYSNRPKGFSKGDIQGSVGPFSNGPWLEDTRKQYTLNNLHQRCFTKGLLVDWQKCKISRLRFTNMVGISMTDREAELAYILEIIISIKNVRVSKTHLLADIGDEVCNEFILDFFDKVLQRGIDESLEQANGQVFAAKYFDFANLKSLGGLSLVWTDNIDDHLRLSPSTRTLKLFWDISILDQSLLFWSHARCLKKFRSVQIVRSILFLLPTALTAASLIRSSSDASKIKPLYELRTTYRLIFHNANARHFLSRETCAVNANKGLGIMIHDLRVNINSSRARKILKHLLQSPVPSKIKRKHTGNLTPQSTRHIWWAISLALRYLKRFFQPKPAPSTLSTFLTSGPPYPLDLCWHLENILLPYPQFFGESDSMRSFSSFPRFEPRLRELKFYLDNQKPSGWYQMWKDKRDKVQYVTFWAVLVFGTVGIVLALASLAVGIAQAAAAFQAVGYTQEPKIS